MACIATHWRVPVVELGAVNTVATVSVAVECGRGWRARPLPDSREEAHWQDCPGVGSLGGRPLLNPATRAGLTEGVSISGLRSVVFKLSYGEKGKVHFCCCSGHWPCCLFVSVAGH